MKKLSFLCALVCACGFIHAQDLITKRDGEDIKAKVLEVNQTEIKYKKFDYLDGPIYSISKSEILLIKYENGVNEIFNQQPVNNYNSVDYGTAEMVSSNMMYKQYKDFYRASDYIPQFGDRYSPVASGLCSFLIPGLGQMICGEFNRGLGYLAGSIGCYVMVGIGGSVALSGGYSEAVSGSLLMTAGLIGMLTVDICAIVDGVRVAKIKNMYEQDLRKQVSTLDVKMHPYLSTISTGTMQTPVAGISLAVSF